ncbi:MAG: hypothetical protein KJ970_02865 [Candidatus Eisenbacteria bacterium]|uniref:Uncharacterized protein n=1 Tax=Eiseniibacteriota bacterium TaxID=2212470 RepID=A0A948W2E1_UNCEI|nr:hypothetical protein [Candidatus Eisenbacteria bacterium]MBU1950132.1 hypothetical protein [Candidatus Eisenbacteria bacterium]MBU2689842.1 hypothetical protein [Candidatus Eisenbacteria bacterium]
MISPSRHVARYCILGFVTLILFTGRSSADFQSVTTNLGILKELTLRSLGAALDSLSIEPGGEIYIRSGAYHETNWLVAESMAELLQQRGWKPVILDMGSPSAPAAGPAHDPAASEEGGAPVEEATDGETTDEGGVNLDDEEGSDATDGGTDGVDEFGEMTSEEDGAEGALIEEGGDSGLEEDLTAGETSETPEPETRTGRKIKTSEEAPTPQATPLQPLLIPAREIKGEVLQFRVLDMGITYPSSRRAMILLGPRNITRLGSAHLRITHLEEPSGIIKGVVDTEQHTVDQFPGRWQPYVEGSKYPFARPVIQPAVWGQLVEPVAVVAIVSGLVYLFYANQN